MTCSSPPSKYILHHQEDVQDATHHQHTQAVPACMCPPALSTLTFKLLISSFSTSFLTVSLLMTISTLPFVTLTLWLCHEALRFHWKLGMAFTSLAVGTLAIWLWSWAFTRGIMRTTFHVVCAFISAFFSHSSLFSSSSAPIPHQQ